MRPKILKHNYLSFHFCIAVCLFFNAYQSIDFSFNTSIPNFTKHISFNDKEKKIACNDFFYEEDEIESSFNLKVDTTPLHKQTFQKQFKTILSVNNNFLLNIEKRLTPIYILDQNLRI